MKTKLSFIILKRQEDPRVNQVDAVQVRDNKQARMY
jgi:hypothetical protein